MPSTHYKSSKVLCVVSSHFMSLGDLPTAFLPLVISSAVTLYLAQGLFTPTLCRTDCVFWILRTLQLYNSSSRTHFYSTSVLVSKIHHFNSYSCRRVYNTSASLVKDVQFPFLSHLICSNRCATFQQYRYRIYQPIR